MSSVNTALLLVLSAGTVVLAVTAQVVRYTGVVLALEQSFATLT